MLEYSLSPTQVGWRFYFLVVGLGAQVVRSFPNGTLVDEQGKRIRLATCKNRERCDAPKA